MNVIIPTALSRLWQCSPNALHAGTVEWYDTSREPRCPICGRVK